VIHHALTLDQIRLKGEIVRERAKVALRGGDLAAPLAGPQARQEADPAPGDMQAATAAARVRLRAAIERLGQSYRAFGVAADGDVQTGESQRIAGGGASGQAAGAGDDALASLLGAISGMRVPEPLVRLWRGEAG